MVKMRVDLIARVLVRSARDGDCRHVWTARARTRFASGWYAPIDCELDYIECERIALIRVHSACFGSRSSSPATVIGRRSRASRCVPLMPCSADRRQRSDRRTWTRARCDAAGGRQSRGDLPTRRAARAWIAADCWGLARLEDGSLWTIKGRQSLVRIDPDGSVVAGRDPVGAAPRVVGGAGPARLPGRGVHAAGSCPESGQTRRHQHRALERDDNARVRPDRARVRGRAEHGVVRRHRPDGAAVLVSGRGGRLADRRRRGDPAGGVAGLARRSTGNPARRRRIRRGRFATRISIGTAASGC